MNKTFFFLSGFARSGSTLLASILNQNPNFYVSPTSPLMDMFCKNEENIRQLGLQYTFDVHSTVVNTSKQLHHIYYQNIDKKYIMDKHRGWTKNIPIMKEIITPNPKVLVTYRHIAECIVSFITLAEKDPDNYIDDGLRKEGKEINTFNRAMHLWEHFTSENFFTTLEGYKACKENVLIVKYDELTRNTEQTINTVYKFLEIEPHQHDFNNVRNVTPEDDVKWRMKKLHDIRPAVEKKSRNPREVLGDRLYMYFDAINQQFEKEL